MNNNNNLSIQHKYLADIDLTKKTAGAFAVLMSGFEKNVLDIGAGPGSITDKLISHGRHHVDALEIDDDAIAILKTKCEHVIKANLDEEWLCHLPAGKRYDIVLATDVLEHLRDPWRVLKDMGELIDDAGEIILCIPHTGYAGIYACLYENDLTYQQTGLLDKTHIRFFGLKNIEQLIEQAGLKLVDARYVIIPPHKGEFKEQWRRLPWNFKRQVIKNRYTSVYQVVVKLQKTGTKVPAISLFHPSLCPPAMGYFSRKLAKLTGRM